MLVAAQPRPRPLLRYAVTLPFPPSVNRIWRWTGNTVIKDPAYKAWISAGYGCVFEQCGVPGKRRPIDGAYTITLELDERRYGRIDQDNCLKAVSDLVQRTNLVTNDKNAWESHVLWGDVENSQKDAPLCRATVDEIAKFFD